MNKTNIEWAKSLDGSPGYTWNPITGCLNHIEGMCQGGNFPCYAYRLANGRLRDRYLANKNTPTRNYDEDCYPFYPRFWEERIAEPIRGYHKSDWWGVTPDAASEKGIFVCDMSDLFGIGIPQEWTKRVMDTIKKCPQDRFYLLTKQPQNLIKWSPFPDNCWVGVTATNLGMLRTALTVLTFTSASVKYLSFEPLLGRMREDNFGGFSQRVFIEAMRWYDKISWLIIGAQTNPYKPPKIEWVQAIVEAADQAGIPVFLKNNLKPRLALKGINQNIFWKDKRDAKGFEEVHLELRQEMPSG